jgi:uncharacterized protein YceK
MKLFITVAVLFVVPFLAGCASIAAHSEGPTDRAYQGVRNTVHHLGRDLTETGQTGWERTLSIIDLPFSAVFDTLCLPCDVFAHMAASRSESAKKDVQ